MSQWVKDPADTAWFTMDWSNFLDTGETIISYTITCDTGVTKVIDSQSGAQTSIKVSGGTDGSQALITASIDTSDTNHYEAEKYIYIVTRVIDP